MKHSHVCSSWNNTIKYWVLFVSLLFAIVMLFIANVIIGSVSVPISDIVHMCLGQSIDVVSYNIIYEIRLPRTFAAAVLGGALALSGYLLQTFFHNPLAGPFVLGISSGAKLFVAIVMVVFFGHMIQISSWVLILAAFSGSMLSMGFVLLISKKLRQPSMLVVSGIMIGYICSAITDLVVTFARDSDIVNLHNWSKGSFSGITWQNVFIMTVVITTATVLVFFCSKSIAAYQLGEVYAANMGVNIRLFRIFLVLLSSILSACVTAFAGPVSFVGIAVPQITKRLFHTAKPLLMIPACFMGGAVWCLFCDLLARTVFAPTELSISTVTAVFGVPVVIYVMIRQKKEMRG